MPQKPEDRDYDKEYKRDHASPTQRRHRGMRNKARFMAGLKVGDKREVDHIKPLIKGGGNGLDNHRVISRAANRKKGRK